MTFKGKVITIKWVWGHPRSPAVSPFDRAHTVSYLTLIETIHLSFTILEL